jgi:Zn-finger nucleic acid-binding protein
MPLLTCPNCNVGMTQVTRSEVEIDVCPQCRGVWLDRGELEKLLQPLRDAAGAAAQTAPREAMEYDQHAFQGKHEDRHREYHDDDQHHGRYGESHDGHGRNGRRQGWRNILDVFD